MGVTVLERYWELRVKLAQYMNQPQPKIIALWGYGEVLYRIGVLETCQVFTRMAASAADTRAQVEHYQMLDAYIQSLALERRYGPNRGPDTQKERDAAQNNLGRVIQDYRKRFSSFSPSSPAAYANEVNRLVNTIMPAWLMFRETFVPIKKLGEEITS